MIPTADSDRDTTLTAGRVQRAAYAAAGVVFVALALLTSTQLYLTRVILKESGTLLDTTLFGIASWIVWAACTPLILKLGKVLDFRRGRRALSVVVHLITALICSAPAGLVTTAAGFALFSTPGEKLTSKALLSTMISTTRLQISVLVYAAILGIGYATRLWERLRSRDLQASRLESQAAHSRLQALGLRLQPHFLFNTLHTIGALVDEDPRQARAMIVNLGDLLRDVLAEPDETEVTLREELQLLRRYLAIEQVRFADRLLIEIVADPDTLDLMVPRLLLQPLVENAARHGIAPTASGGRIEIHATRVDGKLELSVWNDGVPLSAQVSERTGLGTTRARLSTRHGDRAALTLNAARDGVESRVIMPAHVRG